MRKKRRDLLKHAQHMHDNINPIYEPVFQEDTNYPINDGQLIIATEEELQRGQILGKLQSWNSSYRLAPPDWNSVWFSSFKHTSSSPGSGAFGKVYEGRWFPKESVSDDAQQGYPVAIKILKDNNDQDTTREFFDVSRSKRGTEYFFPLWRVLVALHDSVSAWFWCGNWE